MKNLTRLHSFFSLIIVLKSFFEIYNYLVIKRFTVDTWSQSEFVSIEKAKRGDEIDWIIFYALIVIIYVIFSMYLISKKSK